MYTITNWENDMLDAPEEMVAKFISDKYDQYNFKLLSGLKHRSINDIFDSLKESRVIIMQPYLLDKQQVVKIVQSISHSIHVNNNGARREWDIRDFVFLSSDPYRDFNFIKEECGSLKDQVNEHCLSKICRNCEVHFYGFEGEHYEMKCGGHFKNDIYAIRYK